jgi:long-chain acyl-CoA synthetase
MEQSFLNLVSKSIKTHWNRPALSNYQGETYTYANIGEQIEKVALVLETANLKKGDKVALVGRNSSGWAMDFLAILANGYVAVPILHEFKPANIHHIVNHSDSKALFVSGSIWEELDIAEMSKLNIVFLIDNLDVLYAKKKKWSSRRLVDELYYKKHKYSLRFEEISFHHDKPEELAMISYTSGTSGFSKGVMIPYRALWGNAYWGTQVIPDLGPHQNVVSILPMAHMYGLAFEILTEIVAGVHIHFLTKTPSPRIITEMFAKIHPWIIVLVPLVLEKIVRKNIFPKLQSPRTKLLLKLPWVRNKIYKMVHDQLYKALGGHLYEVIIGGAAFSKDVEHFLHQIHFPYTVGYGMTECAPIIAYAPWDKFREGSVGKAIERMQIRIDSDNPYRKVGEIQVKGINTMLGYYRNEEATKEAFTDDGWLKTGDLGVLDQDGYLYIRGRSKNMILGPNGQNIYPEEIEDQINSLPYVAESLVVSRKNNLVALVHPDLEKMDAEKMSMTDVRHNIQISITQLNQDMPAYCKISSFQIYEDEFEKTPKHSIKRFLYK